MAGVIMKHVSSNLTIVSYEAVQPVLKGHLVILPLSLRPSQQILQLHDTS